MAKPSIYAVARGRACGLFTSWSECEKQIKGYPGARYKGFTDVAAALAWLNGGTSAPAGAAPAPSPRRGASARGAAGRAEETPAAPVDFTIYTDGSCLRNPGGPGGWAIVACEERTGRLTERSGGDPSTTNNRMELTAAIEALAFAPAGTRVALYTDSQYLKNGLTRWLAGWKRHQWKINLRYRLRLREKDNAERTALDNRTEQRARASVTYNEKNWNLKTQFDLSHIGGENVENSFGWMVSETAGIKLKNVSLNALFAYFHTDNYDSRLYLYESGPQYTFSIPMVYGHGIRYMLMAQWQPSRRLLLTAKIATTNYFDRSTIGSSYQQINASSMTDLDVQMKWRF